MGQKLTSLILLQDVVEKPPDKNPKPVKLPNSVLRRIKELNTNPVNKVVHIEDKKYIDAV